MDDGGQPVHRVPVWHGGVARSFSAYLADICGKGSDFFRVAGNKGDDHAWSLDLMAMALVLVVSAVLAVSGKQGHFVISAMTTLKLAIIVFILIVGWTRGNPDNLDPFFSGGANGVFSAASVFMYAMTGFDSVSNAAEEARNVSSLPWAMVGTTTLSMTVYALLSLMLCLLVPSTIIDYNDGITDAFLTRNLGYMRYIVATAALIGTLTGLIVGLYAVSRIMMVVARDWLIPPVFARVSARTQTPLLAQLSIGLAISLIALLVQSNFLDELVSFGQLFSMWAVVNAQVFRRYYPGIKLRFTRFGAVEAAHPGKRKGHGDPAGFGRLRFGVAASRWLVVAHIALLSVWAFCLAVWFVVTERHLSTTAEIAGCVVFACLLFGTALSMKLTCPIQYEPSQWHIPAPLMPWVPTVALGLIFFGMASINPTGYYKIGVYNLAVLAIYFFFSLPMSYIKHYKLDFVRTEQLNVVDLVCVDGEWRPMELSTRISALTALGTDDSRTWQHSRVMTWTPQTSIFTRSYNGSGHGGNAYQAAQGTPTKSGSSASLQHAPTVQFDLPDKAYSGFPSESGTNKCEPIEEEDNDAGRR